MALAVLLRRWADWLYVLGGSLAHNPIKPSVKVGDYDPDTTQDPYASLNAYRARPLNGIWATAPYLHNGSVKNLNELMLPAAERSVKFRLGCWNFDPINVGVDDEHCPAPFEFDTSLTGNLNTGHEYGTGKDGLPMLGEEERRAVLEYLKTL